MADENFNDDDRLLIKSMRNRLIELARNNNSMRYQEFSDYFSLGWDMQYIQDRQKMAKFLGHISETEHYDKKPLLSVFIEHENHLPGKGFFTMAEQLGRFIPNFMDMQQFVKRERQFAYEYWKIHKK